MNAQQRIDAKCDAALKRVESQKIALHDAMTRSAHESGPTFEEAFASLADAVGDIWCQWKTALERVAELESEHSTVHAVERGRHVKGPAPEQRPSPPPPPPAPRNIIVREGSREIVGYGNP